MSHELRTPLNAVIGFAELLQAEPLNPTQQHYVELINSAGKHLMELINAVLDNAKIEAGSLVLEQIDFDLIDLLESVRGMVQERASAKGLAFTLQRPDELPRLFRGDPTRLRQVLINLIVNAIKFTETGLVELGITRHNGEIGFHVRDTGIGMDAATLERLFKPFAQADNSITRKYGGTGLGLLISKELVAAMGGQIQVKSQLGSGTCFSFHIPLQQTDDSARPRCDSPAASAQTHATPPDRAAASGFKGRVLLVDDNRVNQQLGVAMLRRLQIECDLAEHGLHALDRLDAHQYSLVLMDMEMPEMDGLTATRTLREREHRLGLARTPVIAMTANALAEDRQRCFDAGMDGYVAKPISLNALDSEIRRLFPGG
jgi:CheY-like chemotaxis protein